MTFDAIRSAIDRMQVMVAGITGYVQARSQEPTRELVDLSELVERVRETLQADIDERGGPLRVEELPSVFGDEHQLERVFLNLISNALKYAGQHLPEIRVYAERAPGEWQISVADNGIGVDEADRDRIFELFARGEVESGSGIGWPPAGGSWSCTAAISGSSQNQPEGAIFRFTLPDEPTVAGA